MKNLFNIFKFKKRKRIQKRVLDLPYQNSLTFTSSDYKEYIFRYTYNNGKFYDKSFWYILYSAIISR